MLSVTPQFFLLWKVLAQRRAFVSDRGCSCESTRSHFCISKCCNYLYTGPTTPPPPFLCHLRLLHICGNLCCYFYFGALCRKGRRLQGRTADWKFANCLRCTLFIFPANAPAMLINDNRVQFKAGKQPSTHGIKYQQKGLVGMQPLSPLFNHRA